MCHPDEIQYAIYAENVANAPLGLKRHHSWGAGGTSLFHSIYWSTIYAIFGGFQISHSIPENNSCLQKLVVEKRQGAFFLFIGFYGSFFLCAKHFIEMSPNRLEFFTLCSLKGAPPQNTAHFEQYWH